jgi:protein-S-isoprenylcysteine O-methyltransferase Ste14
MRSRPDSLARGPVPAVMGNNAGAWAGRGRSAAIVIPAALVGSALHAALLIGPMAVLGRARGALADPAIGLFLLLAIGFSMADLPTLLHPRASPDRPPSSDDRLARRWGLTTGLLLLATFWTALLERSFSGGRGVAWPQSCGALLMLSGVAIRATAVVILGRAFITEWRADDGRPLVERHIYGWVRHPSEAGNLAVVVGACLLLESRLAVAFLLVLGPTTLLRIDREDRRLAGIHGRRFRRYARRVKRLIPRIY